MYHQRTSRFMILEFDDVTWKPAKNCRDETATLPHPKFYNNVIKAGYPLAVFSKSGFKALRDVGKLCR